MIDFESHELLSYLKDRVSDNEHIFIVVDNIEDAREVEKILMDHLRFERYEGEDYIKGLDFDDPGEICRVEYIPSLKVIAASNASNRILSGNNKKMHPIWRTDKDVILNALDINLQPTYQPRKFIRESNEHKKVLHAFDMDDTLVYGKHFEEYIKPLLVREYLTPEVILNNKLDDVGVGIEQLKYENGRIYFDDPHKDYKILKGSSWVRKKGRVYIIQPDAFFMTDESMPIGTYDDIVQLYNDSEYRCIITARNERIRTQTIKVLIDLGLKKPNMGLFMYPINSFSYTYEYKCNKLIELQNRHNFDEIKYYDDNIKLIKKMKINFENEDIPITFYKVTKNRYREI